MARLSKIALYEIIKGYLYSRYGYVTEGFCFCFFGKKCFLWKNLSYAVPTNCCLVVVVVCVYVFTCFIEDEKAVFMGNFVENGAGGSKEYCFRSPNKVKAKSCSVAILSTSKGIPISFRHSK